jgi:hypothetical protein
MSLEADPILDGQLRRLRRDVESHRVFRAITDRDALARFMQVHVYAVWDFMSLAKRLQRDLTCVELPWTPRPDATAARLINEIVLGEESDLGPDGQPASHLELYLAAMREVGASTRAFEAFLEHLRGGTRLDAALRLPGVPACVREFVTHTIRMALHGSTLQVMASFLYGRENVIPLMFRALLERWRVPAAEAPRFIHYLERHIDLDADSHGPAAARLIEAQLHGRADRIGEAREAAHAALLARRELWDGAHELLRRNAGNGLGRGIAAALA